MADEKKIWRVILDVPREQLEDTLNKLADEGYQIHSKDRVCTEVGALGGNTTTVYTYDLVAFNPQLLGAKHAQSMVASMGFGTLAQQMQPGPGVGSKVP